jgi:hypothetical protein
MTWWLVVLLLLTAAMLEREVVMLVFIVVVPAMLIREIVLLTRRRDRPTHNHESKTEPHQVTIGTLRILAWVAVAAAVGQHVAHQFGWSHKFSDALTTALLVMALALTLVARRLAIRQGGGDAA